jgi:hypothetical protein
MLYHYTTIEALFSIIEQMKIVYNIDESGQKEEHWVLPLRATHIGFLNDSTEGSLLTHALAGMKVSQEAVKSAVLQNGKQYVLSFSKKKDDLNMWRSYSDDGYGVMLGFDRDGLEKHVNELYKNDNPMSLAMPVVDCEYVGNEEVSVKLAGDKNLEEYLEKGNLLALNRVLENSLKYKHPCFLDEKETRVIIVGALQEKYRISKHSIVPYQELIFPVSLLKEVMFGPKADFERNRFSISNMLKNKLGEVHMKHIRFEKSELPYV